MGLKAFVSFGLRNRNWKVDQTLPPSLPPPPRNVVLWDCAGFGLRNQSWKLGQTPYTPQTPGETSDESLGWTKKIDILSPAVCITENLLVETKREAVCESPRVHLLCAMNPGSLAECFIRWPVAESKAVVNILWLNIMHDGMTLINIFPQQSALWTGGHQPVRGSLWTGKWMELVWSLWCLRKALLLFLIIQYWN